LNLSNLDTLASLVERERDALLSRWRVQVRQLPSAKHLDTPTLNDHVPLLLEELVEAFRSVSDKTIPEALLEGSPPAHGQQRYQDGYDIVEVVAEYNILRGCLHDLAERSDVSLRGKPFQILNRVFDEAIGLAVQTFAAQQAIEVQRRREEYLAFVAHDLRTPLNAISLAGQVLEHALRIGHDRGDTARMLKTLHRNVKQLQSLVEKVLKENAHIQTDAGVKLERREFDVWPFVEVLIHDLHLLAGTAGARLVNEVPEDLSAYADASVMRRVVENLITNAIKYTPRGKIVIGARDSGGGAVEMWVTDDGAGIPADRLARIFDMLETDPDRADGIGLGLSIVKTFVEAHGGQVTVESQEGVGTTFRFTLPGRKEREG
jgi:signal transduction histidine kinase